LRDEAEELGFREEAAHLSALMVFAHCLPDRESKQVNWTSAEVVKLKQLWLEGVRSAEIATRLGRTPQSIRAQARRYNLPKRKIRRGVAR
jgi:hypothetical protein